MGYRYLTTSVEEAAIIEGYGPPEHRAERDGAYFRELGVNGGTGIMAYIYATQQPGTTVMSQIYRTDLFAKDTRTGPPGTPATGSTLQQHGDHVYTTKSTFEMTQFPNRQHIEGGLGGWRQESVRGFVRELSPNISGALGQARSASALADASETASFDAIQFDGLPNLRDGSSLDHLATQLAAPVARSIPTSVLLNASDFGTVLQRPVPARTNGISLHRDWIDAELADQCWSEFGAQLAQGLVAPWN